VKAILIKTAANPGRDPQELPGWLVPDTEELFGVDMRYECDLEMIPPQPNGWIVTHLPTGACVSYLEYTRAGRLDDAIGIAQRFYGEYKARGWDLLSTDPSVITEPFKKLSYAEKIDFWEKIANWPKESEEDAPQHTVSQPEKP
jgi:hypothetical protein